MCCSFGNYRFEKVVLKIYDTRPIEFPYLVFTVSGSTSLIRLPVRSESCNLVSRDGLNLV